MLGFMKTFVSLFFLFFTPGFFFSFSITAVILSQDSSSIGLPVLQPGTCSRRLWIVLIMRLKLEANDLLSLFLSLPKKVPVLSL